MSDIDKNTTVNGFNIIKKSDANNHNHDVIFIYGLNTLAYKNMGQGNGIYAEQLSGLTYTDLENRYLNSSNNTITNYLSVPDTTTNSDPNSLVNKKYVDDLSNLYIDSGSSLPPSINYSQTATANSLIVSQDNGLIQSQWQPVHLPFSEYFNINGPTTVAPGNTYTFTITNYSNLYSYSITSDKGTVSINNDVITLVTPSTNSSNTTITMVLTGNSYTQNIIVTFTT